jgi:trimeric autotransporter adhesin
MNIFDPLISGSLSVSGSGEISGDLTVLGTIRGTISGTTDNALTASEAPKYTLTSSFHTFTSSYTTGSFTGSFDGDGSGLYNIPSSGITGLNLSQIGQGSSTASISSTDGLRVNTNTEITGALTVTGQISGSLKGDGSNIYNIPASGVTGLNLTRIADGNATASISSSNGLRINSNTEITGALKLNKVELGGNDVVEITVTDAGGKYFINGVRNPRLSFIRGFKYKFLYSNFSQHPFKFSITDNGTHNGGIEYTTGVTMGYSPDYIQIEVTDSTPSTLHYFCGFHVGMGNSISVYSDFLHGQSSINLTNVDTGMYATTGSNNFTNIQRTSGSLVVTGSVDVTGSINLFGVANISGSIMLNGQAIGTGKLDETTFNSYTSSNDGRVSSIETSTGSLNSFTSSINTTIKTKLNDEGVISGSIQVQITGTTGYSTLSSSISASVSELSSSVATTTSGLSSSVATTTSGLSSSIGSISSSVATTTSGLSSSIGSLSSSVETTTSGLSSSIGTISSSFSSTNDTQNGRLNGIETSTGSLNTFTSSIDTTIKNRLNTESVISGSIQVNITGTTGYSTFSSSVSTSIGALSSSVSTTTSGLSSSIGTISSSFSSTNDTQNNRLGSIETSTGSLNLFTSSIDTTIKNKLNTESVVSGSSQILITGTTGYSTFSSSISTSIGALSSSVGTAINGLSSSVATTTNDLSSSIALTTSGLTSTITSLSSSVATTTNGLSSSIGSLSSSVSTTNLNQNNRLDSIEGKSGSYATTGSNIFQGNQTITGSLYISENLIVAGSSSIQHISSSVVNIADNIITVNAQNPALRFGGLAVIDSGSSPQVSGSLLFDATENEWIFIHQNQTAVTSALLIMGPETYNDIGNEIHLTNNRLVKSTIDEHIGDSNITDTGTKVSINSNTEVTGTLKVTGNITSPTITAIETSTSSLNTFTSSLLTAIELTGSNLTVRGDFLVKGTTTNVNTATLDVDNNLINLNGSGATFAGLRVKDTTAPSQISGSLLWDSTNDYWVAGQLGSEQRIVRVTEFNTAVTRIDNVETSIGSLNSFTSSINTTIKSKLNSDGVISGSVQVNHNATTNYDANQHVDHTAVSISAGSGLSGGGTIAATRTLTLDTGSTHFLDGVKKELNTEGVISGSSQVLSGTGIWSGSAQLPSGVVSGSAQVISSLPTGTVSGSSQVLSGTGIWSGSAQLPSGVVSGSSQVLNGTTIHSGAFFNGISVVSGSAQISFNGITDKPTLVSGSSQITFLSISSIPSGLVSGSSQVLSGTGIWSGSAQLPSGVVSGSSQITYGSISGIPGGIVSGSSQITFGSISSIPSGLVSGSSQITLSSTTGYGSVLNQAVLTTSAPTFDQVITSNNGNGTNFRIGDDVWIGDINASNTFRIQGVQNAANAYIVFGNGDTTALGRASTGALTYGGNTVYHAGNLTNLNQLTNGPGYITGINSSAVTTALGFTPYNATNPSGYITGISFANVSSKPTTISGYGITDAITTGNIGSQSVSYASTAGSADQIDGVGFRNTGNNAAVAANTLDSNGMTYVTDVDGSSTNLTGNSTDGALYSQIYSSSWQHQIYGDYRTGIMYARGKNNGTWQSWKRVALSSATTFSSVTSLTFTHNLGTANLTAQVFDTNGDMFFPSNIRISSTQVIVTFASSRSGRLVVTG